MNLIKRISKWWAGFVKKHIIDRDPKDRLYDLYNKKKQQAFRMSRTNRTESDRLEKEAQDILTKIEKLDKDDK